MATLRLRAAAVSDLRSILDYSVDQHGFAAGEAYMATIDRALNRLREFAELGEPRRDLQPDMRSFPCGAHRIYYVFRADHVSVARILHKAMEPRRWLL